MFKMIMFIVSLWPSIILGYEGRVWVSVLERNIILKTFSSPPSID